MGPSLQMDTIMAQKLAERLTQVVGNLLHNALKARLHSLQQQY